MIVLLQTTYSILNLYLMQQKKQLKIMMTHLCHGIENLEYELLEECRVFGWVWDQVYHTFITHWQQHPHCFMQWPSVTLLFISVKERSCLISEYQVNFSLLSQNTNTPKGIELIPDSDLQIHRS